MPKPYWMRFANLGLIRLNQSADDAAGGGNDSDDDAGSDDAGDDTAGSGTGDDSTGGDDGNAGDTDAEPETLEEALEALRKAKADGDAVQRVRRSLDRRSKKDQKRIEQLEEQLAGKTTDDGDSGDFDADAVRDQIRREVKIESSIDRARSEAKAALAGKVNIKPETAVALLGDKLSDAVDDDGELDVQAIADAVDELLEENPGLKVARGDTFQGDADQGPRGGGPKPSEEQQLQEQIAQATKDKNFTLAIGLKQRLAAIQSKKRKG